MSPEQWARDLLERLGVPQVASMAASDIAELVKLLEERDKLREALREVSDSWFRELQHRLDELSIVTATSLDPAHAERARREYDRVHNHEAMRIVGFMKLVDDGDE